MTLLTVGDVVELKAHDRVSTVVPAHLVYSNRQGDFTLSRASVTITGIFGYLAGQYIVYETALDGGGCGHGPHDIYHDGHHVFCVKADNKLVKVDFYQTGSFETCIEGIEAIGRADVTYVFSDKPPAKIPDEQMQGRIVRISSGAAE